MNQFVSTRKWSKCNQEWAEETLFILSYPWGMGTRDEVRRGKAKIKPVKGMRKRQMQGPVKGPRWWVKNVKKESVVSHSVSPSDWGLCALFVGVWVVCWVTWSAVRVRFVGLLVVAVLVFVVANCDLWATSCVLCFVCCVFAGGSNYRVKRSLKLRRWMEERKGEANRLPDALDGSLMIPAIPCKLRAQPLARVRGRERINRDAMAHELTFASIWAMA